MDSLYKAITDFDDSQAKSIKEYSGILGLPTSNKTVDVPNRNGYVYVRLRDNQNEVVQAYNEQVSAVYDLPVIIIRRGGGWYIKGRDIERYTDWGSNSAFIPAHAPQHEFNRNSLGGDIVFIYSDAFLPLAVTPSGTGAGNVILQSMTFRHADGSWLYVGDTGTSSLLPYRPSDNQARMGVVFLDRDTGNPGFLINSGTSFAANITGSAAVLQYLPTIPTDTYEPLYGVRLVSGTQTIQYQNLYDLRQFYSGRATGTGGGGGIPEAPIDGKVYGRKDAGWVEATGTGGSLPTFDANRVVITDNSGNQTVDSQFYYDFALNLLIIGENTIPVSSPNMGNIVGTTGSPSWNLWSYGAGFRGLVAFEKALGTKASPTAITNTTPMGRLAWRGYDGFTYSWGTTRAQLQVNAVGDYVSGTNAGTEMVASITPSGTTTMIDMFTIDERGVDILYGNYNVSGTPHTHELRGAKPVWDSATGYHIEAGSGFMVNGTILDWNTSITRSSLSLAVNTAYYIYLYDNSGTDAVEESTTVPVLNTAYYYWQKTGDATRRCIGFFFTDGSGNIEKFVYVDRGNELEFYPVGGGSYRSLNGGTNSASWVSVTLQHYSTGQYLVPFHATGAYIIAKVFYANDGDEGAMGISPIDLGAVLGQLAPHTVRAAGSTAAGNVVYFGATWIPLTTAQTVYYRMRNGVGTNAGYIDVQGARFPR